MDANEVHTNDLAAVTPAAAGAAHGVSGAPSKMGDANALLEDDGLCEDDLLAGDVNVVKTRLIEKLIQENDKLIQHLESVQQTFKADIQRVKHDAAQVMERLVGDNAWYRDQNAQLQRRLENYICLEKKHRDHFNEIELQREQMNHEKRVLARYVDTLREQKTTLEFQANHLGAAFLTLREAVLNYISNPLALEANALEQNWESRVESSAFQSAVITTIQATAQLRLTTETVDHRLVGLHLLDPTVVLPKKRFDKNAGSLTLMGEKLVPFSQVVQLKKERQMWQRRYMKQQEDIAHLKVQLETASQALNAKELLLKKVQSSQKTSRAGEALRTALRQQNAQLEKELKDLHQKHSETVKLLAQEKASRRRLTDTAELQTPRVSLSRAASSAFLGAATSGKRDAVSPTWQEVPQRVWRSPSIVVREPKTVNIVSESPGPARMHSLRPKQTLNLLAADDPTQSTMLQPTGMQLNELRRESSAVAATSRTLRSPSSAVHTLRIPSRSDSESTKKAVDQRRLSEESIGPPEASPSFIGTEPSRSPSRRSLTTTVQQSEYQSPIAREILGLTAQTSTVKRSPSSGAVSPEVLRQTSQFLQGAPPPPTVSHTSRLTSRFLDDASPKSNPPHTSPRRLGIRVTHALGTASRETSRPVAPSEPLNVLITPSPASKRSSAPVAASTTEHNPLSSSSLPLSTPTVSRTTLPTALDSPVTRTPNGNHSDVVAYSAPEAQHRVGSWFSGKSASSSSSSRPTAVTQPASSNVPRLAGLTVPSSQAPLSDSETERKNVSLTFLSAEKHGNAFPSTPPDSPELNTACSSETFPWAQPLSPCSSLEFSPDIFTTQRSDNRVTEEIRCLLSSRAPSDRILSKDLNYILALLLWNNSLGT